MQPSTRFIRGLTASEASWIQHRLLEEIRSGRPGPDDPETVLARVKQALESQVNDVRACELLSRLDALSDEAMELAFHNIEPEKLPPEEKRRHEAQRATHYRQRQMLGLGNS
jgi:hypothetical protein